MSTPPEDRIITEKEASSLHENRLSYNLYTGRTTNLNDLFHWEKKTDGDHLMTRKGHGSISASLMTLARVAPQGCFTSPKWMTATNFGVASRKHSLKLVPAKECSSLNKAFDNTWKVLNNIQSYENSWKSAKKANLLDGDEKDDTRAVMLKLNAYRRKNQRDPFDKGDWDKIDAWDGDESVKNKIQEIMGNGFVPQLLKVYDYATNQRLSATEVEYKLPGALVEVIYTIKHCYLNQSKTHSFSATIEQIIIIEPLDNDPIPSIFDSHDWSGPLILSPTKKCAHQDEDTGNEDDGKDSDPSPSPPKKLKMSKTPTTPKTPTVSNKKAVNNKTPQRPRRKTAAKKKSAQPDHESTEDHVSENTIESDSN
ncbi:hypothetical protein M407DRAFT_7386 [Tulasnella calospora MUT 4182]|uniref:Uncharacterized protein n=1 Tax=Tulasnella calospora MUT 4182 TaxID=1051891 RepID=A0A0C3QAD5_9AGAM|nr:hypothetical protein M407DRAFT_7386 [Tulasnella calospora MUT 4182]